MNTGLADEASITIKIDFDGNETHASPLACASKVGRIFQPSLKFWNRKIENLGFSLFHSNGTIDAFVAWFFDLD